MSGERRKYYTPTKQRTHSQAIVWRTTSLTYSYFSMCVCDDHRMKCTAKTRVGCVHCVVALLDATIYYISRSSYAHTLRSLAKTNGNAMYHDFSLFFRREENSVIAFHAGKKHLRNECRRKKTEKEQQRRIFIFSADQRHRVCVCVCACEKEDGGVSVV